MSLFSKVISKGKTEKILDTGCAADEFISHMKRHFPPFEYFGINLSDALIEKAKHRIEWILLSIKATGLLSLRML